MWPFKKREPRQEPRVLKVPEDEVLNLLYRIDTLYKERTAVSKYEFWKKIEKLFPETKVGEWVETNTATSITITEIIED